MAKLLKIDGKMEEVKPTSTLAVQRLVGGDFKSVLLLSGDHLLVNEAQWPDALPFNDLASTISGQKIYGNCLLCGKEEKYE